MPIDWFKFENKDLDFPIYNNNPYISKGAWIVLFLVIFVSVMLQAEDSIFTALLTMLLPLIALLYFLKWDYHAIFQKPKANDLVLAVLLFVCYIIYATIMASVLHQLGFAGASTLSIAELYTIPPLFFSIMGEEFTKLIPFLFFLRVCYKYSDNRKLSVIMSMIIVMLFFGSLHAENLNNLIFAIFVQGFGSIFEYIGYIKTKNVFISYITHLLTDIFLILLLAL